VKKTHRVAWISNRSGNKGHGEWMTEFNAEAWAKKGNKEFPEIFHYVESEK
jgi:hypothetical protein